MRPDMLTLFAAALLAAGPASATDYLIQPDGSGDFVTINEAIAAAVDGDRILLANGTYRGDGNRGIFFLGKAISLLSASGDPALCVIDVESPTFPAIHGIAFEDGENSESILDGVTIMNGRALTGGAINCGFSSPTIRNCIFRDNSAWQGGGINCGFSDATFSDCVVVNNVADAFSGGGVYVCEGQVSFRGCTIAFNESGVDPGGKREGGGFAVKFGSELILDNCIVSNSTRGEGIFCDETSSAILTCTNIFGNFGGDWIGCIADQLGTNGNISADPLFCDPDSRDYTLSASSPCLPEHSGCGLMGALGQGCGPSPVDAMSWGKIKGLYRLDVQRKGR